MNDSQRLEFGVAGADGQQSATASATNLRGRDDYRLAEWSAELEHRIELLEEDITLLFKCAGLAGLREQELLLKLGLPDDTLQRHHGELLAEAAVPPRRKHQRSPR